MKKKNDTLKSPKSVLPEGTPTEQSLLAEAKAKGGDFAVANARHAHLVADAAEMMTVRADVKELAARGYPVRDEMFVRIELLSTLLVKLGAQQTRDDEARRNKTALQEEARAKLTSIRHQLELIGEAAELPVELFSFTDPTKSRSSSSTAMRMKQVLKNVAANRSRLSDLDRVDGLVAEAEQLIAVASARSTAQDDRVVAATLRAQVARLLLDVMTHVSKQGLAAYPFDRSRRAAYRLDHTAGHRANRANDEAVVEPNEPDPTG